MQSFHSKYKLALCNLLQKQAFTPLNVALFAALKNVCICYNDGRFSCFKGITGGIHSEQIVTL